MHRAFAGFEDEGFGRGERILGLVFIAVVVVATVADVIQDLGDGVPLSHILGEAVIILACLAAGAFLWRRLVSGWMRQKVALEGELQSTRQDAARWKAEAERFSADLTAAISHQLEEWGLSPAECDVAFLLIKGLASKEIASLRNTSERTVRQQAATIYKKSRLEGRAQLAAFFLEELLTPPPVSSVASRK